MGQPALEGKGQASPLCATGLQEFQWFRESICSLLMACRPLNFTEDVDCQSQLGASGTNGSVVSRQEHSLFSLFIVEVEDSVLPSSPIERNGKGRFTPRERQKRVVESTGHRESDGSEFRSQFG